MIRRAHVMGLIAAVSVMAAGCSDPQPQPPADTAAGGELRVGLVEYAILASHAAVLPGEVVLEVTNAGSEAHDLRVDGALEEAATPTIRPGATALLRFRIPAGQDELVLWCTLPGHRAQGMHARLAVSSPRGTEAVP